MAQGRRDTEAASTHLSSLARGRPSEGDELRASPLNSCFSRALLDHFTGEDTEAHAGQPLHQGLGNLTGALGMDVLKLGFFSILQQCCLKLFT